jgi:transposase-like protein
VSNDNAVKLIQPGILTDRLTEVLRDGARALLTQAVEAEVSEFLAATADLKTDEGCRRVVPHGHLPERQIMTGIGPVAVRQPRVRDREAGADWRALLLDLKRRGLSMAPKVAVADGALGFWKAIGEVWPKTREQRCWVHKTANILNKLPKSQQPRAKRMLQDI